MYFQIILNYTIDSLFPDHAIRNEPHWYVGGDLTSFGGWHDCSTENSQGTSSDDECRTCILLQQYKCSFHTRSCFKVGTTAPRSKSNINLFLLNISFQPTSG